ncbi:MULTISPECIES: asparagine synthase (glutamine-hydrolyzing) [unclassified Mesorhizobium]|uniref:asparagine synthase (glutamine-hydrolyzing) n=2 Tax=Mesorhizobium TaxID=68287 RepID=UPI000BB00D1C|nr:MULTISPECIES: asparagine synthase (glutamine-hydrolyzing) [unclassified Mesorhizobium]TGT56639.1 asparagine synthase (glutamine-hydrolyzing) [Mesorhizobium sp. M00.F.Ca.ET.170.01.1.1]AZO11689.1 asparagine synthase (glutamine-hydrolyzing) [Mesorhizobium sp. M3A.F.Ca.ET.080.04.2.1]PBB86697.1 asparagine synthase (glutamine-hydrolyzing) [Mesorhizobium sp. WSM3876]RWB87053.1 MAG: asparagine synthase (glutamine-hydrolyzing) [Mesorhizobium sp.]RWE25705.1 MAG: asparagine synthase (glutamine-hydroly
MCGIAGVWRKRAPIGAGDRSDIARMMQALAHRGPDDHDSWSNARLALGHRRLSIIDPSPAAREPMLTAARDGVLCYNGEVFNYRSLRKNLEAEGLQFRTVSDTEVVLLALHHWGPDKAVPLFDGMFAFAYFDARDGALWLARDRLGIKPMSFADTGQRLLFASEDKAILACAGFALKADAREITLRLAWQSRDSSFSVFDGIERLPPAGLWKITEDTVEKRRYWHVLDVLDTSRIVGDRTSDAEQMAALAGLLEQSVELHCIADANLATACSGGIDSGLITALARRYRPRMHGYVVDPKLGRSEAGSAERTGRHVGVSLRRVPIDRDGFFDLWPRAIWHLESDGWHASVAGLLALADRCRADGVKVLLTGEGADELFGGYKWQASTMRLWRPSWLRRLLRSKSVDRKFAQLRRAPFRNSIGRGSPWDRNIVLRALSPELNFLQTKLFDRLEGVNPESDRAFLASCLYDLYSHLQDLLHRHDRLSMAASVELRVPFLENRLIDFAIHLPRRQKYRNRTGKWLLKKVAEQHLPRENVNASKIGFEMSAAFSAGTQGLLRGGHLRDAMKWSASELDDLIELARSQESSRLRLVGMEMLLRLNTGGETISGLTEALHAAARDGR